MFPMLPEVVVHIALRSFGLVEWDCQVGKLLIEVIHYGYTGLALTYGSEVCLDQFAIAIVVLVLSLPLRGLRAMPQCGGGAS